MTAPGGYRLGIDLGTTYTAAAVTRGTATEVVGLGNRASAIPSVIHLADDGTVLAGEAADRRGPAEPDRVAREFKRRIGDPTPVLLGGAPHSAEALTAMLLRHVIAKVTELEGGPPDDVALVHPANWGPYKQDLLAQSVRLAGASTTMTLTEPEAAAIAYAANERVEPGSVIAVYDLGGGTFDAAVLRKSPDGFDILGRPEGIERLGGIDFDEAVIGHVRTALGDALDDLDVDDPAVLAALARLRAECVAAKEALSSDTETSIPVILPGLQTQVRLTRTELEQMVRPTLVATVDALRRALSSADVETDDVTAVLMVGGSSRIPLVAELVSDAFDRPVVVDAHPKHAIASGAAIALERRAAARSDSGAGTVAAVAAVATAQASDPAATRATADVAADGVGGVGQVGHVGTSNEPMVSAETGDHDELPTWTLHAERGGSRPLRRVLLATAGAIAIMGLLVVGATAMSRPGTPTDAQTDAPAAAPAVRAIEVPNDGQTQQRSRRTPGSTRDEQPAGGQEPTAADGAPAVDHHDDGAQQVEPPPSEAPAAGDGASEGAGAGDHGAGEEPPVDDTGGDVGAEGSGGVGGAGDVTDPGAPDDAAADTSGSGAASADGAGASVAASEGGEPVDVAGPAPAAQ